MKTNDHQIINSYKSTLKNAFIIMAMCSLQCACAVSDLGGERSRLYASHPDSTMPHISRGGTGDVSNADDVLKFVPDGSYIRMSQSGDIDSDGDDDVLVVLQKKGDEHRLDQRTLLILQRNSHGELIKRTQGLKAISCMSCGGMFGDPLQRIVTSKNGFSLHFEGGSRYIWSIDYRFAYEKQTNDWFLVEIRDGALDRLGGGSETRVLDRSDFESVSVEKFDIKEYLSGSFL